MCNNSFIPCYAKEVHLLSSSQRACSKLGVLHSLMHSLTLKAVRSLYSCVIMSALRYNCTVRLYMNQKQERQLNSFEKRADKLLRTKTVPIRNEFNKQAVILVNKCLKNDVCSNFKDYFSLNKHKIDSRNNNSLIKLPKVKLEFARKGFFFMGAKTYNSLPGTVRSAKIDFKKDVKSSFN